MRVVCPSCSAELSIDVLLSHEAARQAVAQLAMVSVPFGALTLRYIGLFRPEKRGLSIERMVKLIGELLPDIKRGAITRKGRDWDVDLETWRTALDVILAKRDQGKLNLPLTSHGLLYEVIVGLVERVEARAERDREEQRRQHRQAGPQPGPRNLAEMGEFTNSGSMPLAPAAPAPRPYTGPSRAALAIQAQMAAAKAQRGPSQPADAPEEGEAQA